MGPIRGVMFLLDERRTFLEDGYIDSDVPLFNDVKKVLEYAK